MASPDYIGGLLDRRFGREMGSNEMGLLSKLPFSLLNGSETIVDPAMDGNRYSE